MISSGVAVYIYLLQAQFSSLPHRWTQLSITLLVPVLECFGAEVGTLIWCCAGIPAPPLLCHEFAVGCPDPLSRSYCSWCPVCPRIVCIDVPKKAVVLLIVEDRSQLGFLVITGKLSIAPRHLYLVETVAVSCNSNEPNLAVQFLNIIPCLCLYWWLELRFLNVCTSAGANH